MILDRSLGIRHSALWAAYGDALGFMTELADAKGVHWRTGKDQVEQTQPWRRRIGGRFGKVLPLPAGCYSDDTQLRLAVARAIGTGGQFDAEVFAKIELTVWPAYALGGGRGTKQAAVHLARRDVNWFSNFYKGRETSYWESGGNGAAMRIQPHVWAAANLKDRDAIAAAILRDAVCTHGHPRALAGAVLHGWWLAHVLSTGEPPAPADWYSDIDRLPDMENWLCRDEMLATFWLPSWNQYSKMSLRQAMLQVRDELRKDIDHLATPPLFELDYTTLLKSVGGFDPAQVGSGTKTTLLAAVLAWRHRDAGPNAAVIEAANALGSDTDTIATMAGAMLGARTTEPPSGALQDESYIISSADRLLHISQGGHEQSFTYPDPGTWSAPKTMLDAVVQQDGNIEIVGLGSAVTISEPIGEDMRKENCWQWLQLDFGQRVLIKRRGNIPKKEQQQEIMINQKAKQELDMHTPKRYETTISSDEDTVDTKTQAAIRSGFDERLIGHHLLEFAVEADGIEKAIAYAAIILKAKRSRLKKGGGT